MFSVEKFAVSKENFYGRCKKTYKFIFKKIYYSNLDLQALHLISKMLVIDADHRIEVDEAVVHPFLSLHYKKIHFDDSYCFELDNSFEDTKMNSDERRGLFFFFFKSIISFQYLI